MENLEIQLIIKKSRNQWLEGLKGNVTNILL
ncbi:hypothetical protein NF27_GF00030 [Candidatus Jidaibacter acanthamoeba]|uniref:Uncharacterized protein n=1 Tax=Candidatus Jidaibacter acanthamoebae TaxID=86105 RepID=A0A0C1QXH4_9RICK|nr:hypothetical protein NF27_GF00030 [Candidatus Jidaibacter acanthamoeba]